MRESKNEQKQKEVAKRLKKYSTYSNEKILKEMKSSMEGMSVVEIDDLLEEYGKNTIEIENNNSFWKKIKNTIINPFNVVLMFVALITFVTDVVIATNKDYATFLLITSTIIISAIISLIQETKSDNAAKKLKSMISNKIDVIRDGVSSIVKVEEIVPGDMIKLSSGDMIPADVRFLETKDLFIDQASLTGESNPVEKFAVLKEKDVEVTEISNIGFMGTNVISRTSTRSCFRNGK